MGYYMVIDLAALQGVPRELYEAATVDGANKWQQFRNVTPVSYTHLEQKKQLSGK